MLTRQTSFTRAVEAEQARIVAAGVLQGGLEYSRQLLWDARQRDVLTRLDQAWARPIGDQALGGFNAGFQGHLQDLQGKFNLRNLVFNQQVDAGQLQSFQQLCQLIGIDGALGRRISQRVIASYPQRLQAPAATSRHGSFNSGRQTSAGAAAQTLAPRQPMLRSLDDLLGLEGVTPELLVRLEPYVSILPGNTWINGNTASAEVLVAAVPGLDLSRARPWWPSVTPGTGSSTVAISSIACACRSCRWTRSRSASPASGSCFRARPAVISAGSACKRCCTVPRTACPR
ncbi:hypothetical protein PBOI14_35130 [Pseudomonas sp. Boi14]|nr:hypothetical protein PBOI14_35130 [Pseudomonas sp. Boi14]